MYYKGSQYDISYHKLIIVQVCVLVKGGGKTIYTDYGINVATRLLQMDKTQKWLASQLREARPDMFMDGAYLNKILHGERSPDWVVPEINKILGLDSEE